MTRTVAQRQAARLRAIAGHLEQHPHLAAVIVHVDSLQLDWHPDRAGALLEWADSLHADVLRVTVIKGQSFVYATGPLVGGRDETVWTVVDGFATDAPGQVPLARLRDFAAAEQAGRPVGTTRGDHNG